MIIIDNLVDCLLATFIFGFCLCLIHAYKQFFINVFWWAFVIVIGLHFFIVAIASVGYALQMVGL
jgi:hypothetical protein